MSKDSSIKVFAENASGTRPANAIPVWIDNISAIGGGGGSGDEEVNTLVHTNSATWDSVTNKLDTTAFSDVSGTFLTAHQDLSWYVKAGTTQTGSAITTRGDYFFGNLNGVSPTIRISGEAFNITGDFQISDKGVSGHQLAGSSWTALRNTDLGLTTGGTVSSISGHQLAGGGQGGSDTFIIIPGTTTNKEVSENSGKNMLLYMSGSNEYLPYAGKTTYSNYSIFSFKNLSGTQNNFNNANHVRMNIWPVSTSACTVRDVNSVSLLDTNSTVNYAETAYYDGNGNSLTQTFNDLTALNSFVQSNSASWGGSSTGSDTNVIFRKNDYNGSISTYVADASDLYFEAAVSEYEGSPTPLLLNNVNGQGSIQVYWNQVSSDFGYNFYSASVTDLQPGTYEISRNGFTYESCYMSANGVKTEALNQGQYDCSTALAVKFNVQGSNITGYIDGTINGMGTMLTSFTGSLTDFTAKGYERYTTNFGAEDYNNEYNYDLSAKFGEVGSTVASGDVFPPTNNLDPYTTYYLGWNANNGGLQWYSQGGN